MEVTSDILIEKYKEFVLLNGHKPKSVFHFTHHLGIDEKLYYDHFSGFNALEKRVWNGYIHEALAVLQADTAYASYGVRDKMLAFYYTLIEVWKKDRSFVRWIFEHWMGSTLSFSDSADIKKWMKQPSLSFMSPMKMMNRCHELSSAPKKQLDEFLSQAFTEEEIVARPGFTEYYDSLLWIHFMYILKVWVNDESEQFQTTDVAIERSVHLLFDLLGKTAIDQLVDFAKFAFQHKAY